MNNSSKIKRKFYIAGPMRGYPNFNFPAFDKAANKLRSEGHIPISPASIDRIIHDWDFYPDMKQSADLGSAESDAIIRRDLAIIFELNAEYDGLYMLPGWEKSLGACLEHAAAKYRKLIIRYAECEE